VTSFHYRDIIGIEVNTGMLMGVIEINTAAHEGTVEKDYWHVKSKKANPRLVSNTIPIDKVLLKRQKAQVERLRKKVADAKTATMNVMVTNPAPAPEVNTLTSELEKLASLYSSGVLTEEEFQQAKRRLLDQLSYVHYESEFRPVIANAHVQANTASEKADVLGCSLPD
jgi:Short C-terminal domain